MSWIHIIRSAVFGSVFVAASVAHGQTGRVNDTGQTACYDASAEIGCDDVQIFQYLGQDSEYGRDGAALAGRLPPKTGGGAAGFDFTRICWNGSPEGTTSGPNPCTGTLIANIGTVPSATPATDWACTKDNVTGLVWSLHVKVATNWSNAMSGTYPNIGHNSADRCGFGSNWRVPTRRELTGMAYGDYLPAFAGGTQFWSSNAYHLDATRAWSAGHGLSISLDYPKTDLFPVRLVHSPLPPPTPSYTVNGDGTVTDNLTGLMWDQCLVGQSTTTIPCDTGTSTQTEWANAILFDNNSRAGYTDWRLPNKNELESLMDLSESFPALNPQAFLSGQTTEGLWTSTTAGSSSAVVALGPSYAFAFNGITGGFTTVPKQTTQRYVRLVRGGLGHAKYSKYGPATCGSAHATTPLVATAPSTELCQEFNQYGSANVVVTPTSTAYTWTCRAYIQSENRSCSASRGYTLTGIANPAAGGGVTCVPNLLAFGANGSCTQTANAGYTFTGWSGACTGTGACDVTNISTNQSVTANYTLNTYAVNASASPLAGGSVICVPNPVPHGSSSTCTQTPNSGATFTGWSGACSGTGTCVLSNVTGTRIVTANYSVSNFTITATANPTAGGSATCSPNPVSSGGNSSCTQTTNAGFTFAGWSGGCSGTGACNLVNVSANQTVTANYVISTYTITAAANPLAGGSVTCVPNPVNHGSNSTCTQTPNPGATFTGWSGACSGTGACVISGVVANQSVTANYAQTTYTIAAVANPVGGGTVSCSPNPVAQGNNSNCSQTPNVGFTFTGWSGACTGTGACNLTNVMSNQTVTANYAVSTYTSTTGTNPAGGGSVICTPNPVNHGSNTTCTQTPNPGATFTGWSGACTGTGSCVINNVTSNRSVVANYSATTFTINSTASPISGGGVTCAPNPVISGSNVSCSQTPNVGFTFTGWSGACTGTGACNLINVTSNQTVTANYAVSTYTITTSANPAPGGSATCAPNPVNHGSNTSCTQTPNPGATFTGWSGACTGTGACSIANVTSNQSVVANYSQNTYPITSNAIPAIGGTVSCTPNPATNGGTTACTAVPANGFGVFNWFSPCGGTASGAGNVNFTVTSITSACSVTVYFATPALNIDNSTGTTYDAATDGVLLLRYLLGYRGNRLTGGALGEGSSLRDVTAIEAYLAARLALFDVDGDGETRALTDGLMILRRLLNPAAALGNAAAMSSITNNAKQGTRPDAQVVNTIDALKP